VSQKHSQPERGKSRKAFTSLLQALPEVQMVAAGAIVRISKKINTFQTYENGVNIHREGNLTNTNFLNQKLPGLENQKAFTGIQVFPEVMIERSAHRQDTRGDHCLPEAWGWR
jgi:hypothetical protein